MDEKSIKRIGIFVYDWSMYHYIKDLAVKLAETGHYVDIFFKDWDIRPDYANKKDFDLNKNIKFFNFTTKMTKRQLYKQRFTRVFNRLAIFLSLPRKDKPEQIINREILNKSEEIICASQYSCFIGIEKKGLIWAGILSEKYHYPIVYYSLELYIEGNPEIDKVYHLLNAERKYHRLSAATIIQDRLRGEVLLKSNGVTHSKVIYFPVSAKGNLIREKSDFLQNKLHIGEDKKIILYFGRIDPSRFMTQIVKMASSLDEGVILVIHGLGPKNYLDYLQSIADPNKVKFSFDLIAEDEIENLVSSSHIGISLYETTNPNDRFVAFSSSKMAYYTQCGVPMIAFDTESFRELENSFQCVGLIKTIDEIPLKARTILQNYDFYRQQSYAAFQRFYNLDENFTRVLNQLAPIIGEELSSCEQENAKEYAG